MGETVPSALRVLEKAGRLVIAVIRKRNPIPPLAAEIPIIPEVREFRLEQANEALVLLKQGKMQGGAVLRMG